MKRLITYTRPALILGLLVVVTAIWYAVFFLETHRGFRVIFFDVGQGDGIFIQTDSGAQILIDGGPSNAMLGKLGRVMPFWDRTLDLIILTHPHMDHVTGLVEVLKRYDTAMVLESGTNYSTPEYGEWQRLLKDKKIPIYIARAGQRARLSSHSILNILTPFDAFAGVSLKNAHDATVVSRLTYGSTTVLLTGDAEKSLEYRLVFSGANIKSDILKVGHHGSKTSTTESFLAAVAPRYAVISSGRKNRYGHPHQTVLDRLKQFGVTILRTDQEGNIEFVSSGKEFRRIGMHE
ncbi:MAG: MBL fold metallo-hydrolase [Candidatus Sungbacteria bacterium]|nr:MBL fold metallo-hydrolase [Candidatus Sungbacteria bacterium]